MQVKEYHSHGKKMKMLQISNVTNNILYHEYKAKHQITDLINACVSHELRNPLNAIIAKNIEKTELYKQLKKILRSLKKSSSSEHAIGILEKLEEGREVQ